MSNTLTVRNLDEAVKQKLRQQAARHGRSMEAEARDILARDVMRTEDSVHAIHAARVAEPSPGKFAHLLGIWKDRGTTDELMRATRGED